MRENENFSDASLERMHSVSIIVTCRTVCFPKYFIIFPVSEICVEP